MNFLATFALALAGALATACSKPASGTPASSQASDTGETTKKSTVDWKAVEAAMGRPSIVQSDDVHRFNMPRSDLNVTVDGIRLKPSFALGSWVSFKEVGDGVIAMGDLVLRDSEVAPVLSKLQEGNIEQTAIHHHVLRETPRIIYVHVHAHGEAIAIVRALKSAIALTGTPGPSTGSPAADVSGIDSVGIANALGTKGRMNGGVYQVSVPRAQGIQDGGMPVPAVMGLATAINFQPTSAGKAAITGDFVLTASEVNPVIRALRKNGIEVTSLHNHMLTDEPRLFFMHFWAVDNAVKLAKGLRQALDLTASRR
jgi:hypothetical protein